MSRKAPTQPKAPKDADSEAPATVKVGLWRLPADAVAKPSHPQPRKPAGSGPGAKAQVDFARRKGLDRKVH